MNTQTAYLSRFGRAWLGTVFGISWSTRAHYSLGEAAAVLFVRTPQQLEAPETGFDPENVLLFAVDGTLSGYEGERERHFWKRTAQMTRRVR